MMPPGLPRLSIQTHFARKTLAQTVGRIAKGKDSIPLLAALGTAASVLVCYITWQFTVRPDFKALRIASNTTPSIDKQIGYHSNHVIWIGKKSDHTPPEVRELVKSVRLDK